MKDVSNGIVSIIIVAAGNKQHLKSCLESIKKQTYTNTEIIVIDNSLNREFSTEFLSGYPDAKFFSSQTNLSYCEALNKGIGLSAGELILCLNDDVALDGNFVREALRGFSLDEKIGMVSGKILRADPKIIDSTGLFLSAWRSARECGYGHRDSGQFEKKRYVFGVNGAVGFYRKEMLEQIKLDSEYFDSDFRFFYEDLDISWRAQNSGWKGFYIPTAVAYHIRGATARLGRGINNRFARRFLNDELYFDLVKNRYLAIIKNETLMGLLVHLPFILLYDMLALGYTLFFRAQVIKKIFLGKIPIGSAFKKRGHLSLRHQRRP